jgi:hypothetical protein
MAGTRKNQRQCKARQQARSQQYCRGHADQVEKKSGTARAPT